MQISAANLEEGRYVAQKGLYSTATQIRVAVEVGASVVSENRALLMEFLSAP